MPILANIRHERFAQELAKGAGVVEAYAAAGYSPNNGNGTRLKGDPDVQARVVEILAAAADRVEISEAYVLSTIKDTVERCKQAAPVVDRKGEIILTFTPTGDRAPTYAFDSKAVLRGAELLGKHIGMFKERVEHTGKDGGPIATADMTDTEIARRIAFALTRGTQPTAH